MATELPSALMRRNGYANRMASGMTEGSDQVNRTIHHHQVTTSTTTVTAYQSDGAITIKRMKEMAEEQHHRNVELQAANCHLTSQLKQAKHQISELKKAFKAERLAYSDMKSKQNRLDKHLEDFNGILEGIDVAHLKLSTNVNKCQSQQEDFNSKLSKSLEENARIKGLQEENLDRYLKLETRVGGMSDLIAAAKTVNKETWSELVKCRALISEKTEQQEICQAKLEEDRAVQAKLEAELAEVKGKYAADVKQKSIDHEVMKQELSRTVSSLNGYLELRQREHDQKVQAQNLFREERSRGSRVEAAMRKVLREAEGAAKRAAEAHLKEGELRVAKWETAVGSMQTKFAAITKALVSRSEEVRAQAAALAEKEAVIERVSGETERIASLVSGLDAASSKLVMKTSEAEMAEKESQEMRRQLKSLKEEQKQYFIALSNQNASELNKMKTKMKEEVEATKIKMRKDLEQKEGERGEWKEKHDALAAEAEDLRRNLEERIRTNQEDLKRALGSHREASAAKEQALEARLKEAEAKARQAEDKSRAAEEARASLAGALATAREEVEEGKRARLNAPARAPKQAKQPKVAAPAPKPRPKPKPARAKPKPKTKRSDFDDLFEDSLLDPYSF